MSAITVHEFSTNLDTHSQLCRDVVDRGDVYCELLAGAGLVLACEPCAERRIPDLYDGVLDNPKSPTPSPNRTFRYKTVPLQGLFCGIFGSVVDSNHTV
jgi:hypothetical protein